MPAIDAETTAQNMQDAVIQKFMDLGKEEPGAAAPAPTAPAPAPPLPPPSTPKPVTAPPANSDEPSFDKPPEGLSAAASANWKKFRETTQAVIDKKSKELDDVKKLLEDARKAAEGQKPSPGMIRLEEHETLKKKAAELESSLERLDLANSPKFRNYYDGGIEKQIKLARAASGTHGEEVAKLLHQPRSAERNARLAELVEELGIEGSTIANALASITQLKLEREDQLSNHSENLKLLRQQERLEAEASEQSRSASRKAKAEAIVERLSTLPEFKPSETDAEHQAFAASALEFIRNGVAGKLSEDDALLLPAAAMKAQYLEKIAMPRVLKENQELKARLEEIAAARPRMGGSAAGHDTPAKEEVSADDPWGINAVTKRFVQAGQG